MNQWNQGPGQPQPPQQGYPPGGYMPPPYQPPHMHQPQPGNGTAVAGMVLGIVSLVLFWVPILNIILSGLGIIFGVSGMKRADSIGGAGKGMGIAGLACGVAGLLIGLWLTYVVFLAVDTANSYNGY
jgi:hypothetical protein